MKKRKRPKQLTLKKRKKLQKRRPSMPELPGDVIEDILSRLPLNALFRFRRVCRSWYSLHRDPSFIKMQLNRAIENPKILIAYFCKLFFLEFKSRDRTSVVYLRPPCTNNTLFRSSCFGLICYTEEISRYIYLWNPFTGDNERLPDIPSATGWENFFIGYSAAMDEYKILMVRPHLGQEVWVHTLGTQSWRRVECSVCSRARINSCCGGVCLNGALHWTAYPRSPKTPDVIIVFDLGDEKFREMILPDFRNMNICYWIVVPGEHLSVQCYSLEDGCCEIWVMKEYGNEKSWIKKFSQTQINMVGTLKILGSLKNEEILLERNSELFLYHPVDKRIRKLPFCGTLDPSGVHNYVETLVRPMVAV